MAEIAHTKTQLQERLMVRERDSGITYRRAVTHAALPGKVNATGCADRFAWRYRKIYSDTRKPTPPMHAIPGLSGHRLWREGQLLTLNGPVYSLANRNDRSWFSKQSERIRLFGVLPLLHSDIFQFTVLFCLAFGVWILEFVWYLELNFWNFFLGGGWCGERMVAVLYGS